MPWKLGIWIAGLFVASLSWSLFLLTYIYSGGLKPDSVIGIALGLFIFPGIFAGIFFAFMKFRKEKAVAALRIWTFAFLWSAFIMLNG